MRYRSRLCGGHLGYFIPTVANIVLLETDLGFLVLPKKQCKAPALLGVSFGVFVNKTPSSLNHEKSVKKVYKNVTVIQSL